MNFKKELVKSLKENWFSKRLLKPVKNKKTIILSEAEDERVQKAALVIEELDFVNLILLTKKEIDYSGKSLVINIKKVDSFFSEQLFNLRKGKTTLKEAKSLIKNNNYFGVMMLINDMADAMVGGNISTTADLFRPALQLLKKKDPYLKRPFAYSYFLLFSKEKKRENNFFLVADGALNIDPTVDELVVMSRGLSEEVMGLGFKPKVGFLSYSTKGSGKGSSVIKMRTAAQKAKRFLEDVEGELQFDAAVNKKVAKIKGVSCCRNLLLFPNLDSANIGYKIMNQLADYYAIGPFVKGLEKKVSDLSRSCTVEEIVLTVAMINKTL